MIREQLEGACNDCGRKYGDEFGFPDLIIEDAAWAQISPRGNDGGLLCPSCICARLQRIGLKSSSRFTSGPLMRIADDRDGIQRRMDRVIAILYEASMRDADHALGAIDSALDIMTTEVESS